MSRLARQLFGWVSGASFHEKPREPEPVYAKREMSSFFGSLSKEQQQHALGYRGHENHGEEEMRTR